MNVLTLWSLCERSGLRPLYRILKRLKKAINGLNITIRRYFFKLWPKKERANLDRFETKHELNILAQRLYRLRFLARFRIELPRYYRIIIKRSSKVKKHRRSWEFTHGFISKKHQEMLFFEEGRISFAFVRLSFNKQ